MSDQGTAAGTPVDAGNGAAPEGTPGQGQVAPEQQGDALYAQQVADAPEELRPFLIDALRKQDAQITPRLQEAAELRKKFEPYAGIEGFDQLAPDDVAEFIAFRSEILPDPQALGAWMGYMVGENPEIAMAIPEEAWVKAGVENGWLDEGEGAQEGGGPAEDGPPAWFEQYRQELDERLSPVLETVQEQRQQQEQGQIAQAFQARFAELEAQHGELDEAGQEHVARLAHGYLNTDDPIGSAFEDYLRITGRAVGEATDAKLAAQNGATLPGGVPDTSPPNYAHNDPELRKAALARFR